MGDAVATLEAAVHRVLRGVEVGERLARGHPDRVEARDRDHRRVDVQTDERRAREYADRRIVHDGSTPSSRNAAHEGRRDECMSPIRGSH